MLLDSRAIQILLESKRTPEALDEVLIRQRIDDAVCAYKAELKCKLDKGVGKNAKALFELKNMAEELFQAHKLAQQTRALDDIILVVLGPESDAFERHSDAIEGYGKFLSHLASHFADHKGPGRPNGSKINPLVFRLARIFQDVTRSKPQTTLGGAFVRFCEAVISEWGLEEIVARPPAKKRLRGVPHNIRQSIVKAASLYNQFEEFKNAIPAGQSPVMEWASHEKSTKKRCMS